MPRRISYKFAFTILLSVNVLLLSLLGLFLVWVLEYINFTDPISAISSRESPFLFDDNKENGNYEHGKIIIQSIFLITIFISLSAITTLAIPLKNILLFHALVPKNKYQRHLLYNLSEKFKNCIFWYSSIFLSILLFALSYSIIGPDLNVNKEIIKEYSKNTLSKEYENVYFKIKSGRMEELKKEYEGRKPYFFLGLHSNLEQDAVGRSLYFNENEINYSERFWGNNAYGARKYYQAVKTNNEQEALYVDSGKINTALNPSVDEFGFFSLKYKNISSEKEVCVKVVLESLNNAPYPGDTSCSKAENVGERNLIASFPIQRNDTFNIKIKVWGDIGEKVEFSSTKFIVSNMSDTSYLPFCLHYSDPAYPNLFFRASPTKPSTFEPKYIEERPCVRLFEVK